MMSKLIKHEFKNTWKYIATLFVVMFSLSLFEFFIMNIAYGAGNAFLHGISVVIMVIALFGMSIAIFYVLMMRFYQSMFGKEGYLSFTLPVKPSQLIFSKMLVAYVYCLMMFGIFAIISALLGGSVIKDLLSFAYNISGENNALVAILTMAVLISPLEYIIVIYLAMSIGQISNNHKKLMGILAFMGIVIVDNILSKIVSIAPDFSDKSETFYPIVEGLITPETAILGLSIQLGVTILCIVAAFALTNYFCSKKVNLQ